MVDLKNAITLHENMIEGLRMNEQQLRDKLFAEQSAKREEVLELRERDKKIGQLEREVNSSNLMVGIMKSASDSHLVEYRRLMLENSDLRRVSQGQQEKINELLSDIKYLNSKESTLKSELAHAEAKIRELQERLAAQEAVGDDLAKQL
jgi:chromosome segregation ATPase